MAAIEFYSFLLEHVTEFLLWNFVCFLFLYGLLNRILVGGIFDPMFLVFIAGFSTNYAVVCFLFTNDLITFKLFSTMIGYAILFTLLFIVFTIGNGNPFFKKFANLISSRNSGLSTFVFILTIYLLVSAYIISQIGFGFFSDTNRFENSRGFGAFVRFLDFSSVFIISYGTLYIAKYYRSYYKLIGATGLGLFILYSSIINGAKISVIFSIITVIFSLKLENIIRKVSFIKAISVGVVGLIFVLSALWVNLTNNGIEADAESENIQGAPVIVDRLLHRIVANGNTSYLLLPNNIIDQIDKDSALVRFFTPIIGITQMSKFVGYNAGDYSVGRQALLFYDKDVTVSGGPTSHFDCFAYVYFGHFGGIIFVALLAYLLAGMNSAINWKKKYPGDIYFSAIITTLWVRGIIVIVEPTVGLAYLFDAIIFFLAISIFVTFMKFSAINVHRHNKLN